MTVAVTPRDWRSVPVSELISIAHGFAFKGEFFSEYGRDAVTTPGNFLESGGFRYTGAKQRYYSGAIPEAYRLDAGDLIVAMTEQSEGLLGSTAWVPDTGSWLHNQRIGRIRAKSRYVSLKYLYCVFNSFEFRKSVTETAAGTKVKHTSPAKLGEIKVLLPPRGEQDRIAEFHSDADECIAALERLITKKQAIKKGLMQQLLTGRTRLSGFSGDWTDRKIGDFAQVRSGGTPSTAVDAYWGGEIPWMSSGEVHQKQIRRVVGRITRLGLQKSAAQLMPPGTVLIALAGQGKTRGTVAFSRIELATNQSIAGIGPSGEHDSDYLYYNLDSRYSELRGESAGDGGRGGLNLAIIKRLSVSFPSREEQAAIARVLLDVDSELEVLHDRREKARAIKCGMMQELLTGRIRLPFQGEGDE
ncbi:restriction endonuclease subunit S [Streptomyces sp. NPDC000594]|uniref:restriction endonuclease subunit S n=1 Tax=Streptomyces sp. NPDC000594 TaxID=3154261 RepID=UPI0033333E8E